jgi:hypothetical protein
MFTLRETDNNFIGNYMKKLYLALSQVIGKPETVCLYYSSADFNTLVTDIAGQPGAVSLRMSFANYCLTGVTAIDSIVQSGYQDLLTLVFAPLDANNNTINQYYIISPSGGVINVPQAAYTLMTGAFQAKVPLVNAIMSDAGITTFTETRAMWYELPKLNGPRGLLGEISCQNAAGITAFIGCYPEGSTYATPGVSSSVTWQLCLIFELAKSINYNGATFLYHVDTEDTPYYQQRAAMSTGQGEDTGNPCPPATGCP